MGRLTYPVEVSVVALLCEREWFAVEVGDVEELVLQIRRHARMALKPIC